MKKNITYSLVCSHIGTIIVFAAAAALAVASSPERTQISTRKSGMKTISQLSNPPKFNLRGMPTYVHRLEQP